MMVFAALLGTCCAAAFARAPSLISAACVQAIQARQVLRGTVAELVKETRRQESEGEASGFQCHHPCRSVCPAGLGSGIQL